jgi:hypothetical protein
MECGLALSWGFVMELARGNELELRLVTDLVCLKAAIWGFALGLELD